MHMETHKFEETRENPRKRKTVAHPNNMMWQGKAQTAFETVRATLVTMNGKDLLLNLPFFPFSLMIRKFPRIGSFLRFSDIFSTNGNDVAESQKAPEPGELSEILRLCVCSLDLGSASFVSWKSIGNTLTCSL